MFRIAMLVTCLILSLSLTAFAQPGPWNNQPPGHYPERHERVAIDISSNHGGHVSPRGHLVVKSGENVHVNIQPERGFVVRHVIVDGRNIGPVHEYVFRHVERHHEMFVEFEPARHRTDPPRRPHF
jgi:hypothetical protein